MILKFYHYMYTTYIDDHLSIASNLNSLQKHHNNQLSLEPGVYQYTLSIIFVLAHNSYNKSFNFYSAKPNK